MRLTLYILAYFLLFAVYEYMNSVNMTDTWANLLKSAFNPATLLFFALSPVLVWSLNKGIYDITGQRFWFMGIVMGLLEFVAYLVAAFVFYRKLPSFREGIAFGLILTALVIANEDK